MPAVSLSSRSRPRIVIDARPLSHPQAGGYKSYVRSLVRGFAEREENAADAAEILLYLDRPLPPDAPRLPAGVETRILDTRRLRTDLLLFAQQVRRDSPDLVHGTVNYLPMLPKETAATVTIYDALEIKRYPFVPLPKKPRARLMRSYSAAMTRRSARRANAIVTISEMSAREIETTLRVGRGRIRIVYLGVTVAPPGVGEAVTRETTIVLALVSPDPRKNVGVLFEAMAAERRGIDDRPVTLHLVCSHKSAEDFAFDMLRSYPMPARVLRHVDDAALSRLYASSTAFVFPSLLEGFGLPPLEAMLRGCPVVSSCAPPMPEILGDAALFFDPRDPIALREALGKVLTDPALQEDLRRRGRGQAAQFTCGRMAGETMKVWRDVLAG